MVLDSYGFKIYEYGNQNLSSWKIKKLYDENKNSQIKASPNYEKIYIKNKNLYNKKR